MHPAGGNLSEAEKNSSQFKTGYQIFLCRRSGRERLRPHRTLLTISPLSAGKSQGLRSPDESLQTFLDVKLVQTKQ